MTSAFLRKIKLFQFFDDVIEIFKILLLLSMLGSRHMVTQKVIDTFTTDNSKYLKEV